MQNCGGSESVPYIGRGVSMASRAPVTPKRTSVQKSKSELLPLEEQIRMRAYEIYLQRGGQDGSDWDDWLQAETEIMQSREREN